MFVSVTENNSACVRAGVCVRACVFESVCMCVRACVDVFFIIFVFKADILVLIILIMLAL